MTTLAIIGGTGLTSMQGLTITRREMVKTPYGAPSGPILFGDVNGKQVAFLARHGHLHSIPPHRINYCANIWALHSVGVSEVIAVGAVGGITPQCTVGKIVIPDQIIDYTYARQHTFFDGTPNKVEHIDFSEPYSAALRERLISAATAADISCIESGTYGATQGPRLETASEIQRMRQDGCTLVGMTGMPEAALAREIDIAYACCAVVVNPAAGTSDQSLDWDALSQNIESGMQSACRVVAKVV